MTTSKYQGILFDLDGTLIDSREDIALSVNMALDHLGLKTLDHSIIYNFIGNGVPILMQRALTESLGEDPSRLLDPGITIFKKIYAQHLLDNTLCYPDVNATLEKLNQFEKGVITNKPKDFSITILKGLNILSYFSVVIGGDEVSQKKPHPEGILMALNMMKLTPDEVIMIGDSYADVEAGMEAGVTTCFINDRLGKLKSIKPHFIINSLIELDKIIFS